MTTAADLQARISAALRPVDGMVIPPDVARLLARWLAEYAEFRRRPGQSGVPMLLLEVQWAFAEFAAVSSRQQEDLRSMSPEIVTSAHEPEVGTDEAAAVLRCSTDNVRWHFRQGNLAGRKVGRQLMISVASLQSLKCRLGERKGA